MNTILFAMISIFSFLFSERESVSEINRIHNEVRSHFKTNLDSAVLFAKHGLKVSEELGDRFGKAQSLTLLANAFRLQGKTTEAITNFLNALSIFRTIDSEACYSIQANIYLTLGKMYRQHFRIEEAIEFYDKGIRYAMNVDDQYLFSKLIHNKAVAYRKLGKLAKAKELILQNLEFIQKPEVRLLTFNELGLIYRDLKNYEMANSYYDSIINRESKVTHSKYRGWAYHNKASIFTRQKKYVKGWEYYHKALNEKIKLGHVKDLFNTYQDMAELALMQGEPKLALMYASKATPLLDQVPRTPEYYDQYQLLSRCVRDFDPVKGFAYSDKQEAENAAFIALKNELIAMGEGYKMDLITTNYFNQKRQQQQKIRLYWTLGCGILFLLIAAYLFRKVWSVYHYKSPQASLALIKNPNEMLYLLDIFRNEKEEYKRMIKQKRRK